MDQQEKRPRGTKRSIDKRRAYPPLPGNRAEWFSENPSSLFPCHRNRRHLVMQDLCQLCDIHGMKPPSVAGRQREAGGISSACSFRGTACRGGGAQGSTLLRFDSRLKGQQVSRQRFYLLVGELPVWLDRIGYQRLRIAEPCFDPSRRQPIARVVQVGADVAARATDGVAGLALVFDFVKLLAKRRTRGSEFFRIDRRWVRIRMLQRQVHVIGERRRVFVAHVELRHSQNQRGA